MSTLSKIQQLLKEQNKTQKDLTDFLQLKKSTFTSWKSGANESYKKYIDKIADYLDVTTDYLLGNSDERKPVNTELSADDIKFALFGGDSEYISDERFNDVLSFAKIVAEQERRKRADKNND